MEKLRQAKLFGQGLLHINTDVLVARYNGCLDAMGLPPTQLASFTIDAMGWSPEIAMEKGDNYYLTHGEANQLAIVMGPGQHNKPVYFPYYSFSRDLMNHLFYRYHDQIAHITESTAIWLDLEQDLTSYETPYDLLMVNDIQVRIGTVNGISRAAMQQRDLVRRFLDEELAWFDPELRESLAQSARTYGDLRAKDVIVHDFKYSDPGSFFTRAFGGVYILRGLFEDRPYVMIFNDREEKDHYAALDSNAFHIESPELIGLLRSYDLVHENLSYYLEYPEMLALKRECLLVEALSRERPDVDFLHLSSAQKKKYIRELHHLLPPEFPEIERLIKLVKNGSLPPLYSLSRELLLLLSYPNPKLAQPVRRLVWQLLCDMKPTDVLSLYIYHKDKFFTVYGQWLESTQLWAIDLISSRYKMQMDVLEENECLQ